MLHSREGVQAANHRYLYILSERFALHPDSRLSTLQPVLLEVGRDEKTAAAAKQTLGDGTH